jgi:ribosomal RNA-processing protein 9
MATRRKKQSEKLNKGSKKRKNLDFAIDDDVSSASEDEGTPSIAESSSNEDEEENIDAKKIRLARKYLEKLDKAKGISSEEESSDDDESQDAISRKLQRERQRIAGTYEREYADKVQESINKFQKKIFDKRPTLLEPEVAAKTWEDAGRLHLLKGHDLSPTCVALQFSGEKAISGSKDHSVILWDVAKQCKIVHLCPHWKKNNDTNPPSRSSGQILSVACSDDGRYAAVGRADATVSIFDIRAGKNNIVKKFEGHKGPVTSLAFRTQSLQLFSASTDRCIRHYNLNEMLYLETLYGHQFEVMGIDCHRRERPVSVSRDRTARAWKLAEDSHLIYRGGARAFAADAVTVIKDDWFVTGHDDGNISLWVTEKKRAVGSIEQAHGSTNGHNNAIVSIDAVKGSDVFASGSCDGYLRLWKVNTDRNPKERGISSLCAVPAYGFINGIAWERSSRFCVVALGQEHRLGRWGRIPKAKNRVAIIQIHESLFDSRDRESDISAREERKEIDEPKIDFEGLD